MNTKAKHQQHSVWIKSFKLNLVGGVTYIPNDAQSSASDGTTRMNQWFDATVTTAVLFIPTTDC